MPKQLTKILKVFITLLVPILVIGGATSMLATGSYLTFLFTPTHLGVALLFTNLDAGLTLKKVIANRTALYRFGVFIVL